LNCFDDEQRGLGVRVMSGGGKTYLAQYSWHGHKRRIPLGSCNAVSLAKARDVVRTIMGDVAKGIDPAAERKKAKAHEALTLSALLSDWQALHLASKRPSYALRLSEHCATPSAATSIFPPPSSTGLLLSGCSTPWRERAARLWQREQQPMAKPLMAGA
jgi:hypothetical protein